MAKQTFTTGQILTAAQMTTLQGNDYNWTVNAKTASYTLVATDAGTRITMTSASATTITVNTSLFTAGDVLEIINLGTGVCTITAGTATVSTSATLALKQYDAGSLFFNSTSAAVFFSADAADSPLTTKGDLYTYSTTNDRLAVGTNGQYLQADSTAATGLKWATAASSSANSGTSVVAASESTTSTSFTALTTAQAVTVTTGTKALVILTTAIDNAASGSSVMGLMTFAISGATTLANSAARTVAIQVPSGFSGSPNPQASGVFYMTGLTAGSNVFTANFRTNTSTTFFLNRGITVIDMGS